MSSSFGSEGCGQCMYVVVCDAYGRCDDILAEPYPLPVMVDIICCVNDSIIPCASRGLSFIPLLLHATIQPPIAFFSTPSGNEYNYNWGRGEVIN